LLQKGGITGEEKKKGRERKGTEKDREGEEGERRRERLICDGGTQEVHRKDD